MNTATPTGDLLSGNTWTVLVFEFSVQRVPGRVWLYVIPSPRDLEEEFARLAAGGPPVLWPSYLTFPGLREPRVDLVPKFRPTGLRITFKIWKCHVRWLQDAGYDVNREPDPSSIRPGREL